MVSPFGRGFDSLQLHKIRSSDGRPYFVELKGVGRPFFSWLRQRAAFGREIKKGRVSDPFLIIGNLRLETAEAAKL